MKHKKRSRAVHQAQYSTSILAYWEQFRSLMALGTKDLLKVDLCFCVGPTCTSKKILTTHHGNADRKSCDWSGQSVSSSGRAAAEWRQSDSRATAEWQRSNSVTPMQKHKSALSQSNEQLLLPLNFLLWFIMVVCSHWLQSLTMIDNSLHRILLCTTVQFKPTTELVHQPHSMFLINDAFPAHQSTQENTITTNDICRSSLQMLKDPILLRKYRQLCPFLYRMSMFSERLSLPSSCSPRYL